MSLCSIALEKCTARPLWDDIDDLYVGTEGFFGDIWEKIKEFFRNLWHWIRDTWYKFLEFLGIRKKKLVQEAYDLQKEIAKVEIDAKRLAEIKDGAKLLANYYIVDRIVHPTLNLAGPNPKEKIAWDVYINLDKAKSLVSSAIDEFKPFISGTNKYIDNLLNSSALKAMYEGKEISIDRNFENSLSNTNYIHNVNSDKGLLKVTKMTPQNNAFMRNNGIVNYIVDESSLISTIHDSLNSEKNHEIYTFNDYKEYNNTLYETIKVLDNGKVIDQMLSTSIAELGKSERKINEALDKVEKSNADGDKNQKKQLDICRTLAYVFKVNTGNLFACMKAQKELSDGLFKIHNDVSNGIRKLRKSMDRAKVEIAKQTGKERKEFDEKMKENKTLII